MNDKYYDIHAHILPGIDDGARTLEESIQMAEIAYEQGVRHMIATPHYYPGRMNVARSLVNQVYEETKQAFATNLPDMTLSLGNEVYAREGMMEALKSGEAISLAGSRYVLVEFDYSTDFGKMKKNIVDLLQYSYRPIIAHVERYDLFHKQWSAIEEVLNMGCLLQVNVSTLSGTFFQKETQLVKKLLKNQMVHFVASDCHGSDYRMPVMRPIQDKLFDRYDQDYMDAIYYQNPQKIFNNQFI